MAYDEGFEELGRRRPDIGAIYELTRWRPQRSLDEALDEVIAYQQAELAMGGGSRRRASRRRRCEDPRHGRRRVHRLATCLRTCSSAGHHVRILDNFATGRRSNVRDLGDEVELVEGDIQSYERVTKAAAGCEVVLHQAALPSVPRSVQDPLTSNATNVIGTLNVLLAARDHCVRRVVCASSSSVYGSSPLTAPRREDQPAQPISPYATAKLAGEGYARSFNEVYGLETVALRYFNVFGPRQDPTSQYAAVVPNFISALRSGEAPVIFGDGEQSRDFTYVANVVARERAGDGRSRASRARSSTSPAASA